MGNYLIRERERERGKEEEKKRGREREGVPLHYLNVTNWSKYANINWPHSSERGKAANIYCLDPIPPPKTVYNNATF